MYCSNKLIPYLGILLLCSILACNEDIEPRVKSSDITKLQREELGDRIQIALAINDDRFPILQPVPPYDTTVYWYIQGLYNQVTATMRQDKQSPEEDRWDLNRNWQVTILDMAEANAFVIPGGHLYLTTGLLKQITTEHELYYILAFEALLMNERYLLNRLVTQYNPALLVDFSNGAIAPNGDTGADIAEVISSLPFEKEDVLELDNQVAPLICESSLFARDGILTLMSNLPDGEGWFENRPNYTGRPAYIVNEINDCEGNRIRTNGGYLRYVLNKL